ncbi:MAG: N-acetylmuramoyl-L-alanine amidase [Bacteroidia bacterium]|nr:N-acetylmuramoyl-L-alanine amidase [Bacteroidia bacterium]
MDIQNHFLRQAKREALNHSHTILPTYIVVHNTAGASAISTINFLRRERPGVGYHIVIDRNGDLYQCAPFNKRIGHAGYSNWKGLESLNAHSIGISLSNYGPINKIQDGTFRSEIGSKIVPTAKAFKADHPNGTPDRRNQYWETYEGIQIEKLQELIETLTAEYPIRNIVGHDDISRGRKIDPGPTLNVGTLRSCVDLDVEKKFRHKVINVASHDVLNVRRWGHSSSQKVDALNPGEEVYVLSTIYKRAELTNWVAVSRNGINLLGYVHKNYLAFTEEEEMEPEEVIS